ncbi:MAG: hypothetical protein Q8P67_21570 [archaeon]|nr:hypothetical protein [archaeon]
MTTKTMRLRRLTRKGQCRLLLVPLLCWEVHLDLLLGFLGLECLPSQ